MKTKDFLVLGAIAAGAYVLFKNSPASDDTVDYQAGASAVPQTQAPESMVYVTDNTGRQQAVTVRNSKQGVDLINQMLRGDIKVNTLGETLVKPEAIASSRNGGTIVQSTERLASGTVARITVQQPARDARGLSAMDRLIAKNKASRKK